MGEPKQPPGRYWGHAREGTSRWYDGMVLAALYMLGRHRAAAGWLGTALSVLRGLSRRCEDCGSTNRLARAWLRYRMTSEGPDGVEWERAVTYWGWVCAECLRDQDGDGTGR